MNKLVEKLMSEDFKDTFKPADEKEVSKRKQEILSSLANRGVEELQELAMELLPTIEQKHLTDVYNDWVKVDLYEEFGKMISYLKVRQDLIQFIQELLDD